MLQIGDTVLYGDSGVCKITERIRRDFCGEEREYYVLRPDKDPAGYVFVPVDNPALVEKMRQLLTKEEIDAMLTEFAASAETDNVPGSAATSGYAAVTDWIENDAERKRAFDEILQSGNRKQIFSMIHILYRHRERLKTRGKKLHIADERTFREAEKLLYEEFSYVLNVRAEDVPAYIESHIG